MTTQRRSEASRQTAETSVTTAINLDGTGSAELHTGIGFFDHMLEQIARHGLIDLRVHCQGDLHVDGHHTVEDVGITLGQAFARALGDKKGIRRYGHAYEPLDEALSRVVIDFSGRPGLVLNIPFASVPAPYYPDWGRRGGAGFVAVRFAGARARRAGWRLVGQIRRHAQAQTGRIRH